MLSPKRCYYYVSVAARDFPITVTVLLLLSVLLPTAAAVVLLNFVAVVVAVLPLLKY
jgi:hypothetical protein